MHTVSEKTIARILDRYDTDDCLLTSQAFGDHGSGPLYGRLERAALNQIADGEATISRYGIWANTVRDSIRDALSLLESGDNAQATRLLTKAHNSLSAFSEIQLHFDPVWGLKTLGEESDDRNSG